DWQRCCHAPRDLPQQSRGCHLVPTPCSGATESSLFPVAGWRVSFAAKIAVSSTRFIVTRIMTSSLTCRSILYQDGAGLVLFVICRYKVAEIVTSWARPKII